MYSPSKNHLAVVRHSSLVQGNATESRVAQSYDVKRRKCWEAHLLRVVQASSVVKL